MTPLRFPGGLRDYLTAGFDSTWKSRSFLVAMGVLAFFFPFSLFFVAGQHLPPGFGWMSTAMILLVGVATFLSDLRCESVGAAFARLTVISGSLFLIELAGVNTGLPFGKYAYTEELGMLAAGVPAAIPIAWYSTVMNTWRIAEHVAGSIQVRLPIVAALVAGLLTLGLDVALEPMAAFIENYWLWDSNSVPIQNYASWFVLSSTAVYILARDSRKTLKQTHATRFPVALFLFGFHFFLFTLTSMVNGYVFAAALSVGIVMIPFTLLFLYNRGHAHVFEVE